MNGCYLPPHFTDSTTALLLFPSPCFFFPFIYTSLRPSCIRAASSPMDLNNQASKIKFTDFPYVSAPHRNLMVDLVSTLETRLGSQLLPCTLPPDVQYYQNETGTNHASLHIRSGLASSPVTFLKPSVSSCSFFFSQTKSWVMHIINYLCYLTMCVWLFGANLDTSLQIGFKNE